MKKIFLFIFLILGISSVQAQDNKLSDTTVYTFVERMPEYPGGGEALYKFLGKNVKYPIKALENNIQGRVVVEFTCTENGTIEATRVVKSVHPLIDEEAIRVISIMPKWKPGTQNGKPVKVKYSIPIHFSFK